MPDQAMPNGDEGSSANPPVRQDVDGSDTKARGDAESVQGGFGVDDLTLEIPVGGRAEGWAGGPGAAGPLEEGDDDAPEQDTESPVSGVRRDAECVQGGFGVDDPTFEIPVGGGRAEGRTGGPDAADPFDEADYEPDEHGVYDGDDFADHREFESREDDADTYDEMEYVEDPTHESVLPDAGADAFDPWGDADDYADGDDYGYGYDNAEAGRTGAFAVDEGPGPLRKRRRAVLLGCVGVALPLVIFAGVGLSMRGDGRTPETPGYERPVSTSTGDEGSSEGSDGGVSPGGTGSATNKPEDVGSDRSGGVSSRPAPTGGPSSGSSRAVHPSEVDPSVPAGPTSRPSGASSVAPSPVPSAPPVPTAPPRATRVPPPPATRPVPPVTKPEPPVTTPPPPVHTPAPDPTATNTAAEPSSAPRPLPATESGSATVTNRALRFSV